MKSVHASKFFHHATWLVGVLWVGGGLAVSGCGSDEGMDGGDLTERGGTGGSGGAGGMAGMSNGGVGGTGNGGVGGVNTGGVGGSIGQGGSGGSMNADASVPMADPDAGVADAGVTDDEPEPREDLGEGDGQDVITIGDSYMNFLGDGIEVALEDVSGRDYRNYAVAGTRVLDGSGFLPSIPTQYQTAVDEDPDIKTVVMTGGGNDILGTNCADEECNTIVDDVAVRMAELREQMAEDGVEDVVLINYGYPADESRHASLDYSRMKIAEECLVTNTPRCHFIDPVEELDGKIRSDGIHPTAEGYDLLGEMVWELMQEEGMRR